MNPRLTAAAAVATILASLALYPLLHGTWFAYGVGAVLTVAVVAAATRWRTLPAVVCLFATLAAEFLYLNAMFATRQSWAGVVPTRASVHHLGHLVASATQVVSQYQPPVPGTHGMLLVSTGGIGAIAAVTDLLAVRLRRPALAGLPLLALFCVPLTTAAKPGGVGGTLVFCAGIAGYLALLSSDNRQRLPLWGHLVHPWHEEDGEGPDTRALTAAGRRIGAAAVVFALCLPLAVPGLKWHQIFSGSGDLNGPAGQRPGLPSPVVSVDQQLHADRRLPVFTYQTDASQPPYFQIYVLDQLGATWTLVPPTATVPITPSGGLPGVPGLLSTSGYAAVHETVHLVNNLDTSATSAGGATYLPLAYPPRSVRPPTGEWTVSRSTLMVLAQDADIAGMRYQVSGLDVSPTAARLAADPATVYRADLYVPSGLHGLMGLAEQITKGKTTEFGKAVALQQYFTESGQFTYTLNVAPPGTNASIIQFLEKTRRGFCEHFAFSMAILSRLLGIPARVAIGYTAGTQISQGTWQVTTSDAHAWPELYFQGYGWLRFEPTPSASTAEEGQPTALPPPYTATGGGSASPPGGSRPPAGNGTGRPPGRAHGGGGSLSKLTHSHGFGGAVGTTAAHQGPGVPVGLISLAVLALLAVLPTSARVTARHWRWWRAHDDQTRAGAAWRELMDDLTDHKVANRRSDSPRMLARRASQLPGLSEAGKQALERVCLAAERASYAISPADSSSLRQDVATARRALARASSLRVRLRALVLPTSALAPAKAGLQHVLDVFGWIDLASTAVWHRGTRHPHATRSRGPAPVPTGALGRSL